ncbi:MAG: hypothetical protein MUC97_13815 [Bernardetiaceae bacterium]|jgi:hypothetical protein|nr:hypothetical protein [Bernardetiaceae bacterium]
MSTIEAERLVYQHLTAFFQKRQFDPCPDLKQFRRELPGGFQNVILSFVASPGEVFLEVNLGCRLHAVEEIAQQFLDNPVEYRPQANTVVASLGKLANTKYFRYRLVEAEDIQQSAQQIKDFMRGQGFTLLDELTGLKALDELFNKEPYKPLKWVYNQTHRCFKGLVIAKLRCSDCFITLIDKYQASLSKQGASPKTLADFDKLANYLLHYSAN